MARFRNLHDVGVALSEILRNRIDPALDILAGPPLENPTAAAEAIRLTLLWVTPQPTHRNDDWVRDFDGTLLPPPLSLSGFFIVTAYGTTLAGEPEQAYNRLGHVLRVFDREPSIELPNPPATNRGNGLLGIVLVPTAADLMEKIYTPLQMRHRPWALLEVAPIQLESLEQPTLPQPVVRPGGLELNVVTMAAVPRIDSFSPALIGVGGRLRINATYVGTVTSVNIGGTILPAGALTTPQAGGPIFLSLPGTVQADSYDVSITADGIASPSASLTVVGATVPGVDAPLLSTHSLAADLALTGRGLATAQQAIIWPAAGVASPNEVTAVALSGIGMTQLTLTSVALTAAHVRTGAHRIAIRLASNVFTPFVEVEFTP
jgi:hypothetical protein